MKESELIAHAENATLWKKYPTLTNWEVRFLNNVITSYRQWNNISPKQKATAFKILQRVGEIK
ncbi:hypothetical protein QE197_22590 (plasmid) [Arsenophonus nasoniae]|jgi:hypothetical protein|uniref:Phage transcriptional regulator n=1 Tax=Arsenophonus nasoniae TaxID=638 RepID=A0A4P7L1K7_9GAMM|nr:hypothetical protein [Arsenophonus nasoniae]QBY46609.1 hypothetical protein ArsFIN_52200 [Arsenophonus nasoniae]WGM08352.1 hypothetical protein QE258_24025 [Arsenophonus nasoniae]WGM13218.1 hypothetical protein QE197_22590 [Arsenophonus nasoniae]WGM17863.1 hypothetical protein QE193_22320 [Arsenophonus nasoniae]